MSLVFDEIELEFVNGVTGILYAWHFGWSVELNDLPFEELRVPGSRGWLSGGSR
ncbi:hypothetical protein APASM_6612 [Actinosynnema pretiosum subsp. pretiosum]|nr:hypothetical protein APASM_6612 [Actinosynnema pretiosum subsp. pretiosum]